MSIFTTHIDPEATIVQLKEKSEKLKAERDRLREAHEANIKQVRKYRRGTEGHRCEWRVIAEAIESRSVAAMEVE
jgi:hypothetical protein